MTYQLADRRTFLAGDLGEKLDRVRKAAEINPSFKREEDAIAKAIPKQIPIELIDLSPGTQWIPTAIYEEFILETFGVQCKLFFSPTMGVWDIVVTDNKSLKNDSNPHVEVTKREKGEDYKAWVYAIAESINNGIFTSMFHFKIPPGIQYDEHKQNVRAKQDELTEKFVDWCRKYKGEELAKLYNRRFNSAVIPNWDNSAPKNLKEILVAAGMTGRLNGVKTFTDIFVQEDGSVVQEERIVEDGVLWVDALRPYQLDAIWRMATQPCNGLLGLEVGLGKTACGIATAMLRRYFKTSNLAMVVVPKSTLLQFDKTFREMFPTAKVLCAKGNDMSERSRQSFLAKAVLWEWDAIILTHDNFQAIPVRPETNRAYIQNKLDLIEFEMMSIEASGEVSHKTKARRGNYVLKRLEAERDRLEDHLRKLEKDRDGGIRFEDINPSLLIVDEAQKYKNNHYASKIQAKGIGGTQSVMAQDLDVKLGFLRETRDNPNFLLFMTGTPEPTNSIAGVYVFQMYLHPEELEKRGIKHFDAWAKQFGKVVTRAEYSPSGGFVETTRFCKFVNMPELSLMYKMSLHYKRYYHVQGQAGFKRPEPKDIRVSSPLTDFQIYRMDQLCDRYNALKEDKPFRFPCRDTKGGCLIYQERDSEGKKIGKPQRLYHPGTTNPIKDEDVASDYGLVWSDRPDGYLDVYNEMRRLMIAPQFEDPDEVVLSTDKIAKCARNIYRIWKATKQKRSTQLVFLDMGAPNGGCKFQAYQWLKERLIEYGIPKEEIAFIQSAKTDQAKADLFEKVNAGEVRVLIGHRESMGVGVNVQKKVIAMHMVDIPFRPDQNEQAIGRGIRDGNENDKVLILWYIYRAKEGSSQCSADTASMDLLAIKAKQQYQVLDGDPTVREVEEEDHKSAAYAALSAYATGDPRHMELANLKSDIVGVRAKHRLLEDETLNLRMNLSSTQERIKNMSRKYEFLLPDVNSVETNKHRYFSDNHFAIVINSRGGIPMLYAGFQKGAESFEPDVLEKIDRCVIRHEDGKAVNTRLSIGQAQERARLQLLNNINDLNIKYQDTPLPHIPITTVGSIGDMPILYRARVGLFLQGYDQNYDINMGETVILKNVIGAYLGIPQRQKAIADNIKKAEDSIAPMSKELSEKSLRKSEIYRELEEMEFRQKQLEIELHPKKDAPVEE
jgi:hypothetical protein